MIAAAAFFFQIDTGSNGVDALPEGSFTRDAFFLLEKDFSFGVVNPVEILVDGDLGSPRSRMLLGNSRLPSSLTRAFRFPR